MGHIHSLARVPVRFSEINNIAVLMEIASMRDDLVPSCRSGLIFSRTSWRPTSSTWRFSDNRGNRVQRRIYRGHAEHAGENSSPTRKRYAGIVRVYDIEKELVVVSDIISQKIVCFEDGDR